MTAQSKTVIKSYFETGDRPTQSQFSDLIDSYQDANSNLLIIASASSPGTVGLQILSCVTTAAAQGIIGSGDMTKSVYDTANISQQLVGTTATQTLTNKTLTTPTITTPTITGITSGAAASAGNVGEIITATASGVALTSGVAANITSISLTAGQWVISGNANIYALGNSTAAIASISTVSATLTTLDGAGIAANSYAVASNARQILATGSLEVNISSTTTYYLVGRSDFSTSTSSGGGTITARRVR